MATEEKKKKTYPMWAIRLMGLLVFLVGVGVGYFVYSSETDPNSRFPFRMGLDLAGGTHLVYRADTSSVAQGDEEEAMTALRDVIERRVNSRDVAGATGVLDPAIQISKSGALSEVDEWRLIVELPGITDISEATALIGLTPILEFKLVADDFRYADGVDLVNVISSGVYDAIPPEGYIETELTGRFLQRAQLNFGQGQQGGLSNEPVVALEFNTEGAELFAEITREHIGEILAIFLDGVPIELPVIREEIPNGTAIITGSFTPEEAKEVVRNLNLGALPVPIELVSTQTIGASLGSETLSKGVVGGLIGLTLVALFMVLWYRIPGLIAVIALSFYMVVVLAIFKIIPVTLTASGIAGFILSIGMAVDANILIFERTKEELKKGKVIREAIREGFSRAWASIRDGNVSSLITALIIFYAGTFLTKGFAVVLIIGVLTSMITAITITRTLLLVLSSNKENKISKFLYGQGIKF